MLKQGNHKGFTIIEVVITIAIGAAVMALVLNAVQGARRSQRDNARTADIGQIVAAVNQHYGARNSLPTTAAQIDAQLIDSLAYYPDADANTFGDNFVANAFAANSNAVRTFSKWGAAAGAGLATTGNVVAGFTEDHIGIVLEAACNADFSMYEDGGIREIAIIYKLEGQEGIICREI